MFHRIATTAGLASALYMASTLAASAQYYNWLCQRFRINCSTPTPSRDVPEIDVSSGLLAVAAIAATLLLVWELKRRRNAG
ncbi:MAG: VPEID-CTERM sorting domain-containing protein [Roseovarius sp.]|jgi:hypothetical protein